jgi:hypothetical protein
VSNGFCGAPSLGVSFHRLQLVTPHHRNETTHPHHLQSMDHLQIALDEVEEELEERGGLQKLKKADSKQEAAARARASYKIWFQEARWFDEEVDFPTPVANAWP